MKLDSILRIIGSLMAVYGYYEVLFHTVWVGVLISLAGNIISLPWFIRTKCWDVVALLALISSIELTKLLT